MTEITESGALETWAPANCPFTIEYSRRLLDDIRLAVVDAFFSLPRGGAEIGGILLGKFRDGRLTILEYTPLECEHIFGPSFTLSPGDHKRLTEMLDGLRSHANDLQPVGWYHSHTRSDIFLSESDLDIHNRYFSEPWQVALVLRPSTFQPVQAGFFFREPDGTVHTRSSYQEFALDPLPVGQVPRGMPAPMAPPAPRIEPDSHVITLTADTAIAPLANPPVEIAAVPSAATTAATPPAAPMPSTPTVAAPAEPARTEPEPWTQSAGAAAVAPVLEPTVLPRANLTPPALPPLPGLEFVPESSDAPVAASAAPIFEPPIAPVAAEPQPAPSNEFQALMNTEEAMPSVAPAEPPAGQAGTPELFNEPIVPPGFVRFVPSQPVTEVQPQPKIEQAPVAAGQPGPESQTPLETPPAAGPNFLQVEPVRSRRRLWVVGTAAAVILVGAAGYQQRANWLPQLTGTVPGQTPAPATPPPAPVPLTLPLTTTDQQGQLQIRWDGTARAATEARNGILQITDDGATTDLPLDATQLHGGEFTYARHGEHVDARLTLEQLDGTQVRAVASFYGALPEPATPTPAADPALRKQNAELAAKNAALAKDNADLNKRIAGLSRANGELEQRVDELGTQSAKLKSDLTARTQTAKQNAELVQQNTDLRRERDDLAKQAAKLKADLARASAAKQPPPKQPSAQPEKDSQLQQQRDDLLIEIAKLKTQLSAQAQAAAGKQNAPQNSQQNADFSKQRYELVNRMSRLESDLEVANARADRLQRQLDDLRKSQTQRRLQNQTGDPNQ